MANIKQYINKKQNREITSTIRQYYNDKNKYLDSEQEEEEGTEPACAVLVTLRALRVYIWAGILYANILFRWIKYYFSPY